MDPLATTKNQNLLQFILMFLILEFFANTTLQNVSNFFHPGSVVLLTKRKTFQNNKKIENEMTFLEWAKL